MNGKPNERAGHIAPFRARLLLTGLISALYIGFATRTYYWDGVLFSLYIEKVAAGTFSKAALFHPNHLFYNAAGYLLYRAAFTLGFHGRALSLLQGLNIVASVVCASLVFVMAYRFTASRNVALFCLALFSFGATWWKFSTDANSYILSVLFATLAIWLLLQTAPRVLSAAICFVISMMFHELAVFLCVPAIFAIVLYRDWPLVRRISLSVAFVIGSGLAILIAYWVAYRQVDHASAPTLVSWILTRSMDWQPGHSFASIIGGYFSSYLKLFVGGRWTLLRNYLSLPVYVGFAICAGALVLAVFLFRQQRKQEQHRPDSRVIAVLWAWFAVYAIFLVWWEPGAAFHKLYLWPPVVFLVAVRIARRNASYAVPLLAVAAALAAWNFAAFIFPHAQRTADPVLELAQTLDAQLPPASHVYYSNLDSDDWYLEYFAPGRTWLPLPSDPDSAWLHNTIVSAKAPVCFETSALDRMESGSVLKSAASLPIAAVRRWNLVNKQHRIRIECLAP